MSWIEELYFIAPWGGKIKLMDMLKEHAGDVDFSGKKLDLRDEDIPDDEA